MLLGGGIFDPTKYYGGGQALDPTDLGPHIYGGRGFSPGDTIGFVYTLNGGIADFAHIRDNADLTRWVYVTLLEGTKNGQTQFRLQQGDVAITSVPQDPNQLLDLAGAIAWTDAVAHELETWEQWGSTNPNNPSSPQDWSAFSPEDLPSNIMGIEAAKRAIRDACRVEDDAHFNITLKTEIDGMMDELSARSEDRTWNVLKEINGSWYGKVIGTTDWLLRRNFDGQPWFVRNAAFPTSMSPALVNLAADPAPDVPAWLDPGTFRPFLGQFSYVLNQAVRGSTVPPQGIARLPFNGTLEIATNGRPQPAACDKIGSATGQSILVVYSAGRPVMGQFACSQDQAGNSTVTTVQGATQAIRNAWLTTHPGDDQCGFDPQAVVSGLSSIAGLANSLLGGGVAFPPPSCK